MTTRSYPCRLHSRDNDDPYLTNLTQILKIHVDFRVISQHCRDSTSSISEASESSGGHSYGIVAKRIDAEGGLKTPGSGLWACGT